LDADDEGEVSYVVTEWPAGGHLGELLTAGPADPASAAAVVAEAAGALAVAHASGLAHLCLRPCSLWWGTAGEVKVAGLGIAAALTGIEGADPVLADTRGLGHVLYTALTGYWPGAEQTPLPPAPRYGDRVPRPCQMRAGIPGQLDAVVCRTLPGAAVDTGPPIIDPTQLARELAPITGGRSPGPGPAGPPSPGRAGQPTASHDRTQPLQAVPTVMNAPVKPASATVRPGMPETVPAAAESLPVARPHDPLPDTGWWPWRPTPPARPVRARGRKAKAALGVMVMLAVVVLLGAGGWYLAHHGIAGRSAGLGRTEAAHPARRVAAPPPRAAWRSVQPAGAQAFDPYGDGQGDNSQLASLAIDHNLSTAWHTDWYTTPRFGNLKPGTGLLLTMGRVVTVACARIRLGTTAGASFELRGGVGPASLADLPVLAREGGAGGWVSIRFSRPVRARYLLIWFTSLPPDPSGTFQASVFDIRLQHRP
jgi:hypothetical protein